MKQIAIILVCILCLFAGYFLNAVVHSYREPHIVNRSVFRMDVDEKPTSSTTFFVVDSYGSPVPNAHVRASDNGLSGFASGVTNDFGYCEIEMYSSDIKAIRVNDDSVFELTGWGELLSPRFSSTKSIFLIKIDTTLP